jgi:WD40 repeat protein
MTQPLSRRHFLAATAAAGVVAHLPAPAAEVKPSPFAPEPPLPAGVCQRVGSARFRELTTDFRFSADSRWLAQFDGQLFLGCEVASGRRVSWRPAELVQAFGNQVVWVVTTTGQLLAVTPSDGGGEHTVRRFHLETGRELKAVKVPQCSHVAVTPDGGVIQYDGKKLWRTDPATGKRRWSRAWECDASVPVVVMDVTERWVVGVGVKRLHLFDPATGNDGPKLEDALPKDAPPDNQFVLVNVSADGKRLAGWFTAEGAGRVVVWDVDTGKAHHVTPPQNSTGNVLTADGKHLLTADATSRLVGVDVRTNRVTRKLAAENVAGLQLSPDGKVLAAQHSTQFGGFGGLGGLNNQPGGIVRLLNPDTGELLPQSPDPSAEVASVRFADPHTVVAGVTTAFLGQWLSESHIVWDVRTDRRRVITPPRVQPQFFGFDGGFGGPTPPVLSPDATRLASADTSGVFVTDAFTGRRLHLFARPSNFLDSPFWVGRGAVGIVDADGLTVWDLAARTRRLIPLKFPADGTVQQTAATPDGRTLVALQLQENAEHPKGTLAWVDVATGKVTTTPAGSAGLLAVSARGDRVALTVVEDPPGEPSRVRVTVLDREGRCSTFGTSSGFNGLFDRPAELSVCGRTAFIAHGKMEDAEDEPLPVVQFWEVASGELRAEFATAHAASGLGVSPCGRRIATSHRDAPIYLWDVFGETSAPQPKPDKTTWDVLHGKADTAFTAVRRLVQHPAAAVELLSAKLTPAEQPKPEWVKARIDRLGSRDFRTRHTAELELGAVADVIADPLRAALAVADTEEAADRLERLVARAEGLPGSALRTVRAIETLEYCEGKAAGELLKKLAGGAETAVLTREAKAAVRRRG